MSNTIGKVFMFLLLVLATFLWIGYSVTAMTGGEKKFVGVVDVSPEGGETIYWAKGRCFTCHSMGGRGSAVRGPNHGQFGDKFPLAMGSRAVQRAKERSEETGQKFTATDYLVESLSDPGAYVVEGFKNEMAVVYAPPISLNLNEIKALVAYLQSQGGELDLEVIENPSEISKKYYARIAAASAAGGGDPGNGEEMYADNCADCHKLNGEGGDVGPDLSAIAKRGVKFISQSILRPAKKITPGYETYVVVTKKEGRKIIGLKTRETTNEVDITKANGDVVTVAKNDIKEIEQDKAVSLMPDDLTEALTVKDYQDVLAYMMMQKGEQQEKSGENQ